MSAAQQTMDFDDRAHARSTDPDTSKLAAVRAARFATSHANMVLNALRAHGPMTPHELASFIPHRCR